VTPSRQSNDTFTLPENIRVVYSFFFTRSRNKLCCDGNKFRLTENTAGLLSGKRLEFNKPNLQNLFLVVERDFFGH